MNTVNPILWAPGSFATHPDVAHGSTAGVGHINDATRGVPELGR